MGSRGRHDLRLVRRAHQLHHRRRLPRRPEAFAQWWPADLHVIGKDIARFHTIFWPAMLWSAGLEAAAPGLGPRLAPRAGGERMSKSRGNFLDPDDVVAAFGTDGARYVAAPRGRLRSRHRRVAGTRSSAATTRTSPTTSATSSTGPSRWPTATSTVSARPRRTTGRSGAVAGRIARGAYAERLEACLLHEALGEPVGVRRRGEPLRRRRAAVGPRQGRQGRRRGGRGAPARRPRRPRSRPAGSSASPRPRSCRTPRRASSPSSATRTRTGPTATAARRSSTSCAGAPTAGDPGRVAAPEPLFPRLDVETEAG